MHQISILLPVLTLAFWTFIIFAIMAPARFYFLRMKHPQTAAHTKNLKGLLPLWTERVADNYNHLFEQPTLFYALVTYIFLMNHIDLMHVYLAWSYAVLRIVHSIIQITSNNVSYRAIVFIASGLCLVLMITKEIIFFLS